MVQNTSMKPKDVLELTVAELEDLFDGFAECNKESGDGGSKDTLQGSDALKFLMENPM